MIRWARMNGKQALWIPGALFAAPLKAARLALTLCRAPGTDHAGIATQLVVERLLVKEGSSRAALGRDAFLKRVWQWKARNARIDGICQPRLTAFLLCAQEEYGSRISNQIRRLGASCDWTSERFTLDTELSKSVAHAFCELHAQGLVYRGSYLVNWAPQLQTAVSDLEVEYSEEQGTLYYFKYPIAGGGPDDFVPVATSRPETILGDTAVAVHPNDARFAHLAGKSMEVPFSGGRTIPLIFDEYVDPEFGTGALKVCLIHCHAFMRPAHARLRVRRSRRDTTRTITPSASAGTCRSSTS
jgi:valyl-tRNA synthetase